MEMQIKSKTAKPMKSQSMAMDTPMNSTISFTEDQVKGMENCKVDNVCELELKAKVLSIGRLRYGDKKMTVEFEIMRGQIDTKDDMDEPQNTTEARNSLIKKTKKDND